MAQDNPFDQFDGPSGGMIVRDPNKALEADRIRQQMEAERVRLQLAQDAANRAQAAQDKPPAGYRWNAAHTGYEAVPGGPAETGARNARLTPQARASAIAGYKTAQQLRGIIKEIQSLDAAGPGGTHGIAGLADYLPLTRNQRLDAAGNAARGIVGQALGFTGGQLNTAQEAAMAVGPYLPQSGDRDEVRADKIKRLQELADTAEQRSIATLGGTPDENGNITPVAPAKKESAPGALPPMPQSNLGPSQPSPVVDPSGNRQFSTEVDKAFSAEAQNAFNAGATREQLDAIARKYGADPFGKDLDAAIAGRNAGGRAQFSTPATGFEKAGLAGHLLGTTAANPLGSYGIGAANAMSLGTLDELSGLLGNDPNLTQAAKNLASEQNPTASLFGNVTGGALALAAPEAALSRLGVGGTTGLLAPRLMATDGLYGTAYGAGENNDNRLGGSVSGGIAGALGGVAGRAAATGAGMAFRGVRDAGVRRLRDAGVPMTLGQMTSQSGRVGQAAKAVEDRLAGLPLIGDLINARRTEGLTGFNRAAFNEALAPIPPGAVSQVAEGGIQQAQNAVSQAYDDALRGVRVSPDPAFVRDMGAARSNAMAIPNHGPTLSHTLDNDLGNLFGQNGTLTGENLQAALQTLRQEGPTYKGAPLGSSAMGALRDAEGAITGLVGRQSPDTMPALSNANQAYRNLRILEDTVGDSGKNTGGLFTPAQLAMKASQNTKNYGGKAANARGDRPFFDLTRSGQDILPSKIPDSGTAGRLALPAILGGAGAGAGYLGGDTQTGALTGLALALPATRIGQRALETGLLDRPDPMIRIGDQLINRRQLAGMFGAGVAPYLSQGN